MHGTNIKLKSKLKNYCMSLGYKHVQRLLEALPFLPSITLDNMILRQQREYVILIEIDALSPKMMSVSSYHI
jgi:hypothetical protein